MSGLMLLLPVAQAAGRPVKIQVFNPFTGFERRLPLIGHPSAAQMLVDPSGKGYQVFALYETPDEDDHCWSLHRYSSSSDAWELRKCGEGCDFRSGAVPRPWPCACFERSHSRQAILLSTNFDP